MEKPLRPLQGQAIVEILPKEISDAGIIIPEKCQYEDRAQRGIVRRLGVWAQNRKTKATVPYEVKPGDLVLVPKGAGHWLQGEEQRLKLLPAKRILARLESTL
jgi:co-chaperonin GroES (HSP10)